MLIFGFDIGTTSIGWAVVRHGRDETDRYIKGMGVRIFPEARDKEGTPKNQIRRQERMARRQLRRRRDRRRELNQELARLGLLPKFYTAEWTRTMASDPWELRRRGVKDKLDAWELGRALYHLAMLRHFQGRDPEEEGARKSDISADEKKAEDNRTSFMATLKQDGRTLGAFLAGRPVGERKRGIHASRALVLEEFDRICSTQRALDSSVPDLSGIAELVFAQRPVFWRTSTLGACRLMPGEALCPRGSWLSQQRRMLEKLNNLEFASGNRRPLDDEERGAILEKLQVKGSMSWVAARKALAPVFARRGETGMEKRVRFNLEDGGDRDLLGNPLEEKFAAIVGSGWELHPRKQDVRDAVPDWLRKADYDEVGTQRVVIRTSREREERRHAAATWFVSELGLTPEAANKLAELKLPSGWEPFSTAALKAVMPELERGTPFGTLLTSPRYGSWRDERFPRRDAPTGKALDRLPSPSHRARAGRDRQFGLEEQRRLAGIRNPTITRSQNELRKVVNNLIDAFGKPDLIRVELAREVGLSKREREERSAGQRAARRKRDEARQDLQRNGLQEPSRRDIEKWVLWKECRERCPYTSAQIGFDALFRAGEFEVEHIWPLGRSLDDGQRNKTLCQKDVNQAKGNRTPFEYFQGRLTDWEAVKLRLEGMTSLKGGAGMPRGKVRRFLAEAMPDDFTARQLVDTSYAARLAVAQLKRLWPDLGPETPVTVQAVTGRVTAQLRKLWGLNNILCDDGEKTRADHRHHAVDALVVACTSPGMTQHLSRYWQEKDASGATRPEPAKTRACVGPCWQGSISSGAVPPLPQLRLSPGLNPSRPAPRSSSTR